MPPAQGLSPLLSTLATAGIIEVSRDRLNRPMHRREATARAAADDPYLYGDRLTPELPELIPRTCYGVQMLACLKREELNVSDAEALFDRTAEHVRGGQAETQGCAMSGTGQARTVTRVGEGPGL